MTGAYDPDLNLTYWGVGNPGPDFNRAQRPGDNLYSDCVVALDADTGELKWYFQFTPGDPYDYDSTQVPVLVDYPASDGGTLKLMLWGNRNGFFYVLDRGSGRFVSGNPYVAVNWAETLDDSGRPIRDAATRRFSDVPGGRWAERTGIRPSYSPATGLFYLSAWESYGTAFEPVEQEYQPGRPFIGGRMQRTGVPGAPTLPGLRRGPVNDWTAEVGRGALKAIDPATGRIAWELDMHDVTDQRSHDDGIGPPVHRESRGLLLRAGTRRMGASCGGSRSAGWSRAARSRTSSTASSTWQWRPATACSSLACRTSGLSAPRPTHNGGCMDGLPVADARSKRLRCE